QSAGDKVRQSELDGSYPSDQSRGVGTSGNGLYVRLHRTVAEVPTVTDASMPRLPPTHPRWFLMVRGCARTGPESERNGRWNQKRESSLYAEFFGGSEAEPRGLIRRVGRQFNV